MKYFCRICLLILCFLSYNVFGLSQLHAQNIIVGLDADMSSGSARSGIAIKRGAEIAIAEINAAGGVLGRSLELIVRDHRGNPARGADNIDEFASMDNVVAVLGGLHTPVALHELKHIHKHEMIYLSPWAAGTPVVENGYDPNFVFRVSVRDQYAGGFLVKQALKRGYKRIALFLENTGWGRSNERAMKSALSSEGLSPVAVSWFHWGTTDMEAVLGDLDKSSPDVILFVGNAPEGLQVVQSMSQRHANIRVPIISHWGITGGNFYTQAKDALEKVDLSVLQTYSFLTPTFKQKADQVIKAYVERYEDAKSVEDIFAPVGTAHAYDIIHLLAKAINKAQSLKRSEVRAAFENLDMHEGLVRKYEPAFTPNMHDALDVNDFHLARYDTNGNIIPVE